MKNIFEILNEIVVIFFGITASVSIIFGILLPFVFLGYQVILYLYDGYWTSISIIDAMKFYHNEWAQSPNGWNGLWNVLDFVNVSIPISIALIFIGVWFLDIISELSTNQDRKGNSVFNTNLIENSNRLHELAKKENEISARIQTSEHEESLILNEALNNEIENALIEIYESFVYLKDQYSQNIEFNVEIDSGDQQPRIEFKNNQISIEFKVKLNYIAEYEKTNKNQKYVISINEKYKANHLNTPAEIIMKFNSVSEAIKYIVIKCEKIFR